MGQRYHKMEDQKPWPGFSSNQNFAEGRGPLNQKLECLSWETLVYLKQITHEGARA